MALAEARGSSGGVQLFDAAEFILRIQHVGFAITPSAEVRLYTAAALRLAARDLIEVEDDAVRDGILQRYPILFRLVDEPSQLKVVASGEVMEAADLLIEELEAMLDPMERARSSLRTLPGECGPARTWGPGARRGRPADEPGFAEEVAKRSSPDAK